MGILIVDASETLREQLEDYLREAGHETTFQAATAPEALDVLRYSSEPNEGSGVGLILLSIDLPDTDGVEAIRLIRAREAYQDIPILVLCAKEDEERLPHALEAGAVDFLKKPVDKLDVLVRAQAALRLREEMVRARERETHIFMLIQRLDDANEKIQFLTKVDGLTGVANLRYFEDTMENEWRRAIREYHTVALLLVNVDRFEAYNSTYGHLRGDVCLKRIAGAIGASLHRPGDLLGRYGGDEFVVLLPNTDHEGALKVAEQIRINVASTGIKHASSEVGDLLTLSIGVAVTNPVATTDPPALIAAAEEALSEVRTLGGNQVGFGSIAKPVTA